MLALIGLHVDDPLSPTREWPGLNRTERQIAYMMTFGLPVPRRLDQAAKDCGYRAPRARRLAALPAFRDYLAALEARKAADGQ
jgi:hypothetical protein